MADPSTSSLNHPDKLSDLLLLPGRQLLHPAHRGFQLRFRLNRRQHNTALHHPHLHPGAGRKTCRRQPLALHDQRRNKATIWQTSHITHRQLTLILRRHFWIKRIYNTISISHGCYSLEIVIVISGAGVRQHIRTALNNTCKPNQ